MFGYFTFSFLAKEANNTLCIHKSSSNYNKLHLINVIEKSFKNNVGMDNILIIANIIDFEYIKQDSNNLVLERDKKISNICLIVFDENGDFFDKKDIKGSLDINYLNEIKSDIVKYGLLDICRNNSVINVAPPGTQFKKLTGKVSTEFIRTSDMLSSDSIICFIAFSLLPFWRDNKINYIYTDTMSIIGIIYKLIDLKKIYNSKIITPNVITFSSYSGIDKIDFVDKLKSLVIISASTSCLMAKQIVEKYAIEESKIITLLSFTNPDNNTKLLCNISTLSNKSKSKSPGLTNIQIVGEYFTSQINEPREILIKFKHAPVNLKDNIDEYIEHGLFTIQKNKDVNTSKEIYVDKDTFINTDPFLKWYNNCLEFHAPLHLSYIIHTNDTSSKLLANIALDFYKRTLISSELPKVLSSKELGEKSVDHNAKGILIVSSVLSKGQEFLSIGRDLRSFAKNTSRTFIVGISLPISSSDYDRFKSSLTYSPNRENYNFYTYWTLPIGQRMGIDDNTNSWELEKELLSKFDFEELIYAKERLEILLKLSEGLKENIFNSTINGNNIELRDDFVFWKDGYSSKGINLSPAVYLTVSVAIQNARENDNLTLSEKLISDDYQRAVLSPDCFLRFNDGIIQASLLRTCNPKELDYSISSTISKKMKEILLSIIKNVNNQRGEATIEFLIALATKRMKLTLVDLKEINEYIKSEEMGKKLNDKKDFCFKLIDFALK